MAEKTVKVSVIVDDDGTLRLTEKSAQRLGNTLKKTGQNAQTVDRRLKGAAQASSNASKNFSKQAQGITGGLVPAYATLAANIFAISAAFNFFKKAADVSLLRESQEQFAISTGVGLKRVAEGLQEASGGMLTFQKASEAAAIGVAKGFSTSQLESLAEGARKASAALGRDFEDSFDRLVRGVSKAEPELLDELGITLRLETATKRYSQAIGKAAKSLNTYEKSQAVLVEVQRQLDAQFADFNPRANPFVQLQVTFDRLVKILQKGLLPVAETVANVLNESPRTALLTFGALGLSIAKSALPLEEWESNIASWGNTTSEALEKTKMQLDSVKQAQLEAVDASAALKAQGEAAAADAGKLLASQTDSKFAQRLASGEKLEFIDVKRFDKDLARVEAQIINNGRVIKGVYQGASLEAVLAVRQALAQIILANQQATVQTQSLWQKTFLFLKRGFLEVKEKAILAAKGITKAFAFVGKQLGRLLRLVSLVGVFSLVTDLLGEFQNKIRGWLQGIFEFLDSNNKYLKTFIAGVYNLILFFIQAVARVLSFLPIVGDAAGRLANFLRDSYLDIQGIASGDLSLADAFGSSQLSKNLKLEEEANKTRTEAARVYEKLVSSIDSYKDSLFDLNDIIENGTALQRANAIQTLNAAGEIRKAQAAANKEGADRTKIFEKLLELYPSIRDQAKLFGVTINKGVEPKTLEDFFSMLYILEDFDSISRNSVGAVDAFKNAADSLGQTLGEFKGGSNNFTAIRVAIETLDKETINAVKSQSKIKGEVIDTAKEIENATTLTALEIKRLSVELDILEKNVRDVAQAEASLEKARLKSNKLVGKAKELFDDELKVIEQSIALRNQENKVKATGISLTIEGDVINRANLSQQQIDQLRLLDVQRARLAATKEEIDQFNKLNKVIGESLVNNLSTSIQAFVQGSQSFKEALSNLALGVAKAIADFTTQILALQILKAILPERFEIALGLKPDPAAYKEVGKAIAEEMTAPEQTDKYKKAVEGPLKKQTKALEDSGKKLNTDLMATFDKASRMLFKAISEACRGCKCSETATSDSISETVVQVAAKTAVDQAGAGQKPINGSLPVPTGGTFEGYTLPPRLDAIRGDQPFYEKKPEGADKFTMFPKEEKKGFFDGLKDIFGSFKTKLGEIFNPEGGFLNKLGGIFKGALDGIGSFFSGLFGGGGAGGGGGGIFSTILQGVMSIFGFAMGGVAQGGFRAYANGGVVSKPTLGLVGEGKMNEAIVPLPDGKSIPVMGSTSSQTNNVNVSVAVNNEGQAQTSVQQDSQNGANLGRLIASVVQEELQTQKRPGGLLSPYGAA